MPISTEEEALLGVFDARKHNARFAILVEERERLVAVTEGAFVLMVVNCNPPIPL
jgi:hypothetical protein